VHGSCTSCEACACESLQAVVLGSAVVIPGSVLSGGVHDVAFTEIINLCKISTQKKLCVKRFVRHRRIAATSTPNHDQLRVAMPGWSWDGHSKGGLAGRGKGTAGWRLTGSRYGGGGVAKGIMGSGGGR